MDAHLPGRPASLRCGSASLGRWARPRSSRCQPGSEACRPAPLPQSEGSREAAASCRPAGGPPQHTHTQAEFRTVGAGAALREAELKPTSSASVTANTTASMLLPCFSRNLRTVPDTHTHTVNRTHRRCRRGGVGGLTESHVCGVLQGVTSPAGGHRAQAHRHHGLLPEDEEHVTSEQRHVRETLVSKRGRGQTGRRRRRGAARSEPRFHKDGRRRVSAGMKPQTSESRKAGGWGRHLLFLKFLPARPRAGVALTQPAAGCSGSSCTASSPPPFGTLSCILVPRCGR